MNKRFLFYFFPILLGIYSCSDDGRTDGSITNGIFSIADGKYIRFSQGNLQYQASTNIWRFAEHQWDIIGDDNRNISPTFNGWIDLFGWGTSGWNNGNSYYKPYDYKYDSQKDDYGYGPVFDDSNIDTSDLGQNYLRAISKNGLCLTSNYDKSDWGIFNKISNGGNEINKWRTLSIYEWMYIFVGRPDADKKISKAIVDETKGLVLLPDKWEQPKGISFIPKAKDYSANIYNQKHWKSMELNGAVFLPLAGKRSYDTNGVKISGVNEECWYWSSTTSGKRWYNILAEAISFDNYGFLPMIMSCQPSFGLSVRLVQDMKNDEIE